MQQLHHTVELVSLSGSRLTSARRGRGARRQGDADGGVQSRDSQNSLGLWRERWERMRFQSAVQGSSGVDG